VKTVIFPGQGSQCFGMGATLFDEYSQYTRQADEILGYSIKALCHEDPGGVLHQTQFTQPALYVVNALSYIRNIEATAREPDFLAGHSLGEFNALLAAGCFDFETGLRLVKRRGELMSRISGGAMGAVLNTTPHEVTRTLRSHDLNNVDIANYNTPAQVVISGCSDEVSRARAIFASGATDFYPLKCSGAFHSRFMHAAREEFQQDLQRLEMAELRIPVVSNVTARIYPAGEARRLLAEQMTSTVRWCETIQYLMGLGTSADPMQFVELGPGEVLTKLVRTIGKFAVGSARVC
jgi:malonyl CoA-acyl carrier protein transacylase